MTDVSRYAFDYESLPFMIHRLAK